MILFIIISTAVLAAAVIYALIENRSLAVKKYSLSLPSFKKGFKAVHITDIHKRSYKNNWEKLIRKVDELSPDVIFLTGDLVSRTETDYDYKGVLIRRLCDICPVYCCLGNHELDLSSDNLKRLIKVMTENGAVVLDNKNAVFEKDGSSINIYGASLKRSVYRNENNGFSGLESYTSEELYKALGSPEKPSILLAHDPFFLDSYSEWGADLIFSGHVHGGLVGTPFGGLLSPERKFFPKFTKGIYKSRNSVMILSAGIGKYRIFCPPEIVLLSVRDRAA